MTQTDSSPASPEGAPADLGTEGGTGEAEVFTLPENFADTVKSWELDDLSRADEYVKLGKALETEEGVIDGFIGLGQKLGLGVKDLERLFAEDQPAAPQAAAPVPAPAEAPDPDRLLTQAEVDKLIEERVLGPQREAQERQAQELQALRQKQTFDTIDQWFAGKEGLDDEAKQVIVALADRTIPADADSWDPKVAVAALERGAAAYEALMEKQAQAYIAKKAAQGQALPTNIGSGSTPGGEAEEAPDYVAARGKALDVARARVRARLRAAGEME